MKRKLWEAELEEKLQRAAAAHSEHIEEVVRTQRNLFEIEQKQKASSYKLSLLSFYEREILRYAFL